VRQSGISVVVLICVAAVVGGCGGSDSSDGGSSGPYGNGLKLGTKVLNSAPVGASVAPWYRWNGDDCKFEVAKDHPADYKADIRAVEGGGDKIGYMHYGNSDPFGVSNSKSVDEWAKKAGMPLDVYNLKFPSRTEPNSAARTAVVKGDKGVLQANLDPTVLPAFFQILEGDGCIPSVQLYIPIDGRPAMGNNWPDVGKQIGKYIGEQATKRGWKPEETALVQCTDPDNGPSVNVMFEEIAKSLPANGLDVPKDNVFDLVCKQADTQTGYKQVTDWFTGHPDFKHVALTAIDTIRMPNMIRAVKKQSLAREDWIAGAGADDESSRKLVRSGDQDVSIAFFGERFGEWLIPMIQDLMAGNPVPSFLGTQLVPLTKDNIDEYYPQ
jgi:ribose transport system substrate-binding protein